MTAAELSLFAHFSPQETRLDGQVVNWASADFQTFWWLNELREHLGAPIRIIRETHPPGSRTRPTSAVDWCCPNRPYGMVVLAALRLPGASLGFYSGASVHTDFRAYGIFPNRWLAVKPSQEGLLKTLGLRDLVYDQTPEWLYLPWRQERAWDVFSLVVRLAETGI